MKNELEFPSESIWKSLVENQRRKALKMLYDDMKALEISTIGYLGFSIQGKDGALGLVVEKNQRFTDWLVITSAIDFPYKPGFFYYHIKPLIDKLAEKELTWPNLVFVPGHGTLHPRGYGLACEIADQLKIPVAGIAKELIHRKDEGISEEEYLSIHYGKKLLSISGKPVYISTGGYINLDQLVQLVIQRLKPNGSLEGFQRARNIARQALL